MGHALTGGLQILCLIPTCGDEPYMPKTFFKWLKKPPTTLKDSQKLPEPNHSHSLSFFDKNLMNSEMTSY